jgi:hypothetical protein
MRFPVRHLAAAGALVLISTVPLAACGDEVAPLPAEAAAPAVTTAAPTTSSAAPPTTPPPSTTTTSASPRTRPVTTTTTKAPVKTETTRPQTSCWGSIRYDLDLQNTELALVRSMCFHTGGVLRLQGIGPGLVTAEPQRLVTQNYEAGVVDIRFVRAGTVTVTIPQDEQTHTITVVVRS